jgi:Mg2+ and Co2+ transporter CorA
MREETKSNPTAAEEYFDYIIGVMKENEGFLRKNAEETCAEVIELINDAIDNVRLAVKRAESRKDYTERSMAFFIYHILMPFSYAIYVDLLAGNVPACFMELRLILESLVECYLADSRYQDLTFFQERLESLERENLSTSKLMKDLGKNLGAENDFVALWGKLSQDWVHTKGIADKVVGYVLESSDVPPWALPIPMNYTEDDLDTIEELQDRVSQFRDLLITTMDEYQQEHGFCA